MKRITIVRNGEDWEAVYFDGMKIDEGHRIEWPAVFAFLGFEIEERMVPASDEIDAFPPTLK